jgi:hypothetical protein
MAANWASSSCSYSSFMLASRSIILVFSSKTRYNARAVCYVSLVRKGQLPVRQVYGTNINGNGHRGMRGEPKRWLRAPFRAGCAVLSSWERTAVFVSPYEVGVSVDMT